MFPLVVCINIRNPSVHQQSMKLESIIKKNKNREWNHLVLKQLLCFLVIRERNSLKETGNCSPNMDRSKMHCDQKLAKCETQMQQSSFTTNNDDKKNYQVSDSQLFFCSINLFFLFFYRAAKFNTTHDCISFLLYLQLFFICFFIRDL